MRKRQGYPFWRPILPYSIPLNEIQSIINSELEGVSGSATASASSSPALTTIMTTAEVPIPVSTVLVDTTILRTSFVTVKVTTQVVRPKPTCRHQDSSNCIESLPTIVTGNQHTSLPSIVTSIPSSSSSSSTTAAGPTRQISATPSATSIPIASKATASAHKHAIIGGLCGTIAGLILIGLLICLWLRRRRPREDDDGSAGEKGTRSSILNKWTQAIASKTAPIPPPHAAGTDTPNFEGGPIRIGLQDWPRPFAHNKSFRESIGPGRLRVMNPDPSRPTTPAPRPSEDRAPSFLRRQQSSITAVLFGGSRSRASSSAGSPQRGLPVPAISIDPVVTEDHTATYASPPSFKSYPSVSSSPVVQQRPPEDPFQTPPNESSAVMQSIPEERERERTLIPPPLQSAASVASRTLSRFGSVLNPFRSKATSGGNTDPYPRHSNSTFSSAGDPFQLDRPSMRLSNSTQGRFGNEPERAYVPSWRVYEGT